MRIGLPDVPALERGVSLLGSGGGGETAISAALLRAQLATHPEVSLTPVADLPADAQVVPVGVLGSTAVFSEKLPVGTEFRAAVHAIERWTGRSADAVLSLEVGGPNGINPLVAALDLDLPAVDADLSGRGLPRLDQFSVAVTGNGLAPVALAEPSGQVLVVAEGTVADVEQIARAALTAAGGWTAIALAPIPARDLPKCAILNTISAALSLGRQALALGENPDGDALADATGGRVLGLGRVIEVSRRPGPGEQGSAAFGRGSVTVEDHDTAALLRLEMENEYLLAMRDGEPVASTPDILSVLDRRTGEPILCEVIRRGAEVAVLQLPAPDFWTDPRRLPMMAPRAFDIDCDPILMAVAE
jgi:uncharacterized protein